MIYWLYWVAWQWQSGGDSEVVNSAFGSAQSMELGYSVITICHYPFVDYNLCSILWICGYLTLY